MGIDQINPPLENISEIKDLFDSKNSLLFKAIVSPWFKLFLACYELEYPTAPPESKLLAAANYALRKDYFISLRPNYQYFTEFWGLDPTFWGMLRHSEPAIRSLGIDVATFTNNHEATSKLLSDIYEKYREFEMTFPELIPPTVVGDTDDGNGSTAPNDGGDMNTAAPVAGNENPGRKKKRGRKARRAARKQASR